MTYETLLVETRGAVTLITLNRPQALNALNSQVLTDLIAAFAAFDADESQRCAVLTGVGALIVLAGPVTNFLFAILILAGFNLALGHQAEQLADQLIAGVARGVCHRLVDVDDPQAAWLTEALSAKRPVWHVAVS